MQAGSAERSRSFATQLSSTTSNEDLRLIADGAKLMIDATTDGNIPALAAHLRAMAERQRGVHPHYFGVTMLNLAIETISQDQPGLAIELADQAIDALEETSSRIEMAAALMAKGYALALLGRLDDAHIAIENAVRADEIEANYERADVADSFDDPEAAGPILDFLDDVGLASSPLLPDMSSNLTESLVLQPARSLRRGSATIELPHDVENNASLKHL